MLQFLLSLRLLLAESRTVTSVLRLLALLCCCLADLSTSLGMATLYTCSNGSVKDNWRCCSWKKFLLYKGEDLFLATSKSKPVSPAAAMGSNLLVEVFFMSSDEDATKRFWVGLSGCKGDCGWLEHSVIQMSTTCLLTATLCSSTTANGWKRKMK